MMLRFKCNQQNASIATLLRCIFKLLLIERQFDIKFVAYVFGYEDIARHFCLFASNKQRK